MEQGDQTRPNGSFPKILEDLRRKRGLSGKEVGKALGKSHQYISALESGGPRGRVPSVSTLRDLVLTLCRMPGADAKQVLDMEAAVPLIFSALDLDWTGCRIGASSVFEEAVNHAEEIWMISDLAEVVVNQALAFLKSGKSVTFVVPFLTPVPILNLVLEHLEDEVRKEELRKQLRVYLSNGAISARMWITDLCGSNPKGFYCIGDGIDRRPEFDLVPFECLVQVVSTYSNLVNLHRRVGLSSTVTVGREDLGHIRLYYPADNTRTS